MAASGRKDSSVTLLQEKPAARPSTHATACPVTGNSGLCTVCAKAASGNNNPSSPVIA
ncbi:hypothetical protein RmaAA213_01560 [Rhodothermus marinus]|nr:hypothetical protein RmaAA213_01560 [Rhodothermus marinus]BBM71283.1 hypothetical protein RmaAA338_01480 [Rhodothermus marinus]